MYCSHGTHELLVNWREQGDKKKNIVTDLIRLHWWRRGPIGGRGSINGWDGDEHCLQKEEDVVKGEKLVLNEA